MLHVLFSATHADYDGRGVDLQETCSTFEIDWAALALAELDEHGLVKIMSLRSLARFGSKLG